ncbi:MAG: tetratricopeptide repeat protein [Gammaproteobacteria bacterium]
MQQIESEWAVIYYQTPKPQRPEAYQRLIDKTDRLSRQHSNAAEIWYWKAVLLATYADHQSAMAALDAIEEARDLLLKTIQINPKTLSGSAYVTLGTLYYMVPKWPVSFGDNDEARKMLETALAINPDGLDANYFFGDFLLTNDQPDQAVKYLEKAVNIPARKEQLFADNHLKTEAKIALLKALKKQKNQDKDIMLSLFSARSIK